MIEDVQTLKDAVKALSFMVLIPLSIIAGALIVVAVVVGYGIMLPGYVIIMTVTYPLMQSLKSKEKRRPYRDWFSREVWFLFIK